MGGSRPDVRAGHVSGELSQGMAKELVVLSSSDAATRLKVASGSVSTTLRENIMTQRNTLAALSRGIEVCCGTRDLSWSL